MTQHNHSRLDAFVSLVWYDTLLRFITNFIAKTSELLLAAGLVVSSANFLTDGTILGTTTPASQAWAWSQALAIDIPAWQFLFIMYCSASSNEIGSNVCSIVCSPVFWHWLLARSPILTSLAMLFMYQSIMRCH